MTTNETMPYIGKIKEKGALHYINGHKNADKVMKVCITH